MCPLGEIYWLVSLGECACRDALVWLAVPVWRAMLAVTRRHPVGLRDHEIGVVVAALIS